MGHTEDKERAAATNARTFRILVEGKAGENDIMCEIHATDAAAAVYGVSLIVRDLAKATGRSLESTICLLASLLLTPKEDGGAPGLAD